MRIPIALLLVFGLILGGVAYYLFNSLDSIVAAAIEEHGSRATGTPVRVGGVRVELSEGRATIRDLRVANPEGFKTEDAFTLGEITVDLDLGSLGTRLIPMTTVVIGAPVVHFELKEDGTSNLGEIYDNLDRETEAESSTGTEAAGSPPDLLIEHFRFEQGRIHADATALDGPEKTLELPELDLRDLGAPEGAPPARIGKMVVNAMMRESGKQLAQAGLESYIERKLGGKAGEAVKKALRGVFN